MLRLVALLLAAATVLSGCNQAELFDKLVPKEEAAVAKDLVAKLAARDFRPIESMMDPQYQTPQLPAQLEQMAAAVPPGTPTSVRVVGANTMKTSSATTYRLTMEYEYPSAWLLTAVTLERRDGKLVLQGMNFVPRKASLESENSFSLTGKSPIHYIVFALAIAVPLFTLFALVLCIRTKFEKRKWLWVLFVTIGFVQFRLDWTSGAWDIQPISFLLLGAAVVKAGPVASWVLSVTVPVGAILFMIRRHLLRGPAPTVNVVPPAA